MKGEERQDTEKLWSGVGGYRFEMDASSRWVPSKDRTKSGVLKYRQILKLSDIMPPLRKFTEKTPKLHHIT